MNEWAKARKHPRRLYQISRKKLGSGRDPGRLCTVSSVPSLLAVIVHAVPSAAGRTTRKKGLLLIRNRTMEGPGTPPPQ